MATTTIHFTTVPCGLGWLLVARTRRGVCNLRFGDAPEALAEALADEFPWAHVREDGENLASCVAALRRYLEGRTRRLDLPLDVRGSQFQRRVWDAIRAIPYGETRSYGELAIVIGRPKAARAVAGACAANRVALAIPCHRVVASNDATGGYRWGAKRKAKLLELEKKESDESLSPARMTAWQAPPSLSRSRPAVARRAVGSSTPPSSA